MFLVSFFRSLVALVIYIFMTFTLAIVILLLSYIKSTKEFIDRLVVFWGQLAIFLFNIEVNEYNRDSLPLGPCVFLFNHSSFFDVFVLAAKLNKMRFGSKIELFKIPFFGQAMKRIGVLPIARQNREEAYKVYERAIQVAIDKGQQYALAPEGTRQSEEKLGPFKAGPFVFAIKAQVPIVPVVIKGAAKILPKNGIIPNSKNWKGKIEIYYLNPILTEGLTLQQRRELQQSVFFVMNQKITSTV